MADRGTCPVCDVKLNLDNGLIPFHFKKVKGTKKNPIKCPGEGTKPK